MASLKSLRDLASCWSIIFGKALSIEGALARCEPSSGRPDFIDARTEQMRSALDALKNLETLATTNPSAAKIMALTHIVWGETMRATKDNWADLGALLRAHTPKKSSTGYNATLRGRLIEEGLLAYGQARKLWEAL